MDCCEKTTRLPPLTRGSTLTFDTEVLQNGKVRVNIEVNEKIVTFDWQVEKPPAQTDTSMSPLMAFGCGQKAEKSNEIRLYFAMKFTDPSWKVGVEWKFKLNSIRAWIYNYKHSFLWDVITHPCFNFDISKIRHGWVIVTHSDINGCNYLSIL